MLVRFTFKRVDWIDLRFGKCQRTFINEWKIEEIIITPEKVIIPFKKEI